ncbi:hypothetical protein ACFLRI_04305, partial [Bacteroidota bacterium]
LDKVWKNIYYDLEKDKVDEEMSYKFQKDYVTVFEIPENYTIDFLPEAREYLNDYFGYTSEYFIQGNTVKHKKTIYINTLIIKSTIFKDWNDMIDVINDGCSQVLVLSRNNQ